MIERVQYNPIDQTPLFHLRIKEQNLKENYYRDVYTVIPIEEIEKSKSSLVLKVTY